MNGSRNWVIEGGAVLREGGMEAGDLALTAGLVAADAAPDALRHDATGLWLLPGIVDVHGDAIERIVMPRPGVTFPLDLALAEADRQLLANGITTAFHGLTVSWEPGLRSVDAARAFVTALAARRHALAVDTRINFRWETFALDAMDEVAGWFGQMPGAIFSLNDHTTAYLGLAAGHRKIARMAERMGCSPQDCVAALARVAARADEVPGAVARMAAAAAAAGLALFAHDELSPEMRAHHRRLGIAASEFPMTEATARSARAAAEPVVLGAPNVLRGGSQNDAIDAAPAILAGLGTVLASDYYYPAPLLAAFRLADEHGLPFAAAWSCVSAGAATAAGLADRGRLAAGQRADVVAVCPRTRRVRTVFVAGERKLDLA